MPIILIEVIAHYNSNKVVNTFDGGIKAQGGLIMLQLFYYIPHIQFPLKNVGRTPNKSITSENIFQRLKSLVSLRIRL